MLVTWVVFLVWTLTYNGTQAFDMEKSGIDPIWGMPRWVFFGILVPWIVGVVLTFWFATFFMKDTNLIDVEEEQVQAENAEEDAS